MESFDQTIINDNLPGIQSGNMEKDIYGHESKERIDFSHVLYRNLIRQQFRWRNVLVSPFILEAQLILYQMLGEGRDGEETEVAKILDDYLQVKDRFANRREQMIQYYERTLKDLTGTPPPPPSSSRRQLAENDEGMTIATTTYFMMELVMLLVDDGGPVPLSEEHRQLAQKSFMTRIVSHSKDCAHNCQHQGPSASPSPECQTKDAASNEMDEVDEIGGFLMSSLTFVHKWFLPFSGYRTGYGQFHTKTENGVDTCKSVLMMFDNEILVKFMEIDELDARAVKLPFECMAGANDDGDAMLDGISMLLLLPNQRHGLHQLEMNLNSIKLNEISDRMQMENVQMLLPKFHIDWSSGLKSTLENMGLKGLFRPQSPLPLTEIYQRTTIDVHEMGSEPTAPKVYEGGPQQLKVGPLKEGQRAFHAHHPFFFAIRKDNCILLMGHLISI